MKNVTTGLLFFIMMTIGLTSCDPNKEFKVELNEVDSCLALVDSMETLFDGIDFDTLNYMLDHVLYNESVIKEKYNPDTLSEWIGKRMNESKWIRKALKNIENDEVRYGDELNAVKHQFLDLKEDIKNGIFNREQVEQYLAVEKKALSKVSLAFGGFYAMQNAEIDRFEFVQPAIDSLVETLKNENEELE